MPAATFVVVSVKFIAEPSLTDAALAAKAYVGTTTGGTSTAKMAAGSMLVSCVTPEMTARSFVRSVVSVNKVSV